MEWLGIKETCQSRFPLRTTLSVDEFEDCFMAWLGIPILIRRTRVEQARIEPGRVWVEEEHLSVKFYVTGSPQYDVEESSEAVAELC